MVPQLSALDRSYCSYDVMNLKRKSSFMFFAVFGHEKSLKFRRNSRFAPRLCNMKKCINLQPMKCNRLGVVELLRHNCRKSAVLCLKWLTFSRACFFSLQSSWRFIRKLDLLSLEKPASLLMDLLRHKLSKIASKFDDLISPSKME